MCQSVRIVPSDDERSLCRSQDRRMGGLHQMVACGLTGHHGRSIATTGGVRPPLEFAHYLEGCCAGVL